MVYQWKGIQLSRDSWQQFSDKRGKKVEFDQLKTGDLIFWGKSNKKIQHVGMYLEKGTFIHTSSRENKPFLRVSKLSDREWNGDKNNHYPFIAAKNLAIIEFLSTDRPFGQIQSNQIQSLTFLPKYKGCLLYTSPSPRDRTRSRMPSSA